MNELFSLSRVSERKLGKFKESYPDSPPTKVGGVFYTKNPAKKARFCRSVFDFDTPRGIPWAAVQIMVFLKPQVEGEPSKDSRF